MTFLTAILVGNNYNTLPPLIFLFQICVFFSLHCYTCTYVRVIPLRDYISNIEPRIIYDSPGCTGTMQSEKALYINSLYTDYSPQIEIMHLS